MKSKITITEALQEVKTIDARIQKKKEFVFNFLFRQNTQRDPHKKDGGSAVLIAQERQAINDLLERKISIRTAINIANAENSITIGKQTRTISEWLVWKRDVAPTMKVILNETADTASTWTLHSSTSFTTSTAGSSDKLIYFDCSKTGAPGNLYFSAALIEVTV